MYHVAGLYAGDGHCPGGGVEGRGVGGAVGAARAGPADPEELANGPGRALTALGVAGAPRRGDAEPNPRMTGVRARANIGTLHIIVEGNSSSLGQI